MQNHKKSYEKMKKKFDYTFSSGMPVLFYRCLRHLDHAVNKCSWNFRNTEDIINFFWRNCHET